MKPRERVMAALAHQEADRCPFQASATPEFVARMLQESELGGQLTSNPYEGDYAYDIERALGLDMLLNSVGWANSYYMQAEPYTDEWGVGWVPAEYSTPYGKGHYTEIAGHPLAEDDAIAAYTPPDPDRPELYAEAVRLVEGYRDEFWIVGTTVTTIFECAWALRGLDRLMMDFIEKPELADAILEIPFRYHLTAAKKLVEIGVDMIWIGDDVGAQRGMMISPEHWRTFLKPKMAEFISTLKNMRPEIVVAYHSDGDVYPIIPELIEVGVDVLNPIQPLCMDPARLKRDFGDRLCFWGSIDEQHTLPFGTPTDVETEVLTRLKTIGKGGGLIVGPTHHVQLDTPIENFWAMVNTVTGTPYKSLA
jgi:uroporphyrinogen decarboxylase